MENMKHRRLQELDRSDFEIVEGEPDIRGWDVRNSSGQKIGEVEELILDAQNKKVRYMVVDLDDNELDLDDRRVLIPIGLAELDKDEDDVLLPTVTVEHLRALPKYDEDKLDEEMETRICSTFGRKQDTMRFYPQNSNEPKGMNKPEETHDFYRHEHFNDDNLYRNRLHEAQPAQHTRDGQSDVHHQQKEEYERGLRLWEVRSEGGIIANSNSSNTHDNTGYNSSERVRDMNDERRMEIVRNRRKQYEDRRGSHRINPSRDRYRDSSSDNTRREDNSISARIDREGLQDA
ncbi:PRC-barrel domain-containing protein [Flavisolibacter sp. BT320]|nr:PRC-barrel domain-containing protein [Flavisolibacter longurius]